MRAANGDKMNNTDKQYIELCKKILAKGSVKGDRTGTGTLSLFGETMRFDLSEGFPLLTTKEVHFKSVVGELLWFLRGDTNIKFLQDNGIKIWDAWANNDGEIGALYGKQWRNWDCYADGAEEGCANKWDSVDQIADLIREIRFNPDSRRLLVSTWNVADLPDVDYTPQRNADEGFAALAPCHYSFQCYVNDGKLSLMFNMRSNDIFLGAPFNIASYALLTHMLAQVCNLEVGELIWSSGDCHIYSNHVEQVKTQIKRFDNGEVYTLPYIILNPHITDIDDFSFDDITLMSYCSGSKLTGKVAV